MPDRTVVTAAPTAAPEPSLVRSTDTARATSIRVMKFGGTSVATAERLRRIADLAAAALAEERVALVLSAVSGVTDLLLDGLRVAAAGGPSDAVARYRALHASLATELAAELGEERLGTLRLTLEALAVELEERLRGVALLRDCSPRVEAHTVTLGERASSAILAALLEARGLDVLRLDPLSLLPCIGDALEATPQPAAMRERLAALRAAEGAPLALLPGFYGGDGQGQAMCLGRGGSDYSAALLAQALDARRLEIWTDVDGIFTTDPRIAPAARVLATLSFDEALELAHFGAKVLHPRTIAPARAAGIPVRVCNTLRPEQPGTLVGPVPQAPTPPTPESAESRAPGREVDTLPDDARADQALGRDPARTETDTARGISFLRGVAVVSVFGPGMPGVPGVAARIFGAMAQHGISVILITQGSSETAVSLCVREAEADEAVAALHASFDAEIAIGRVDAISVRRELAIVSLVGDGMRERAGVAGGFFGALGEAGVNVAAIAQGASERSISAVVADSEGERAVRAVHRRFFEPPVPAPRALDLYLAGKGTVGGELLRLLAREREALAARGITLRLRAVASHSGVAFEGNGIDHGGAIAPCAGALSPAESPAHALLAAARAPRQGHAVLVDCTGDADVAALYADALASGIDVVAASKLANSAPLAEYRRLRAAARSAGARFAYSANVGGGLPILPTLRRLRAGGDRVMRFAGVVSGSLSLIFGLLEDGLPFSAAVAAARERGFTEPDPRDDLAGRDVQRKVLILAREAGLALEPEDVAVDSVLPAGWDASGSVEEFFGRLPELDPWFAERVRAAALHGRVLRYAGSFEAAGEPSSAASPASHSDRSPKEQRGSAQTGIVAVGAADPLRGARDGENVFSFWSASYTPRPLVISGYGAGASVTAAAVLADLLDLLPGGAG